METNINNNSAAFNRSKCTFIVVVYCVERETGRKERAFTTLLFTAFKVAIDSLANQFVTSRFPSCFSSVR